MELSVQEDQTTDTQFYCHSDPHSVNAKSGYKHHCKPQTDDPHTKQIHKAGNEGVLCTPQRTGGGNGNTVKRLGQQTDSQDLHTYLLYGRHRGQQPENQGAGNKHHSTGQTHHNAAEGGGDDAVPSGQRVILCPNALPYQGCRGRADAVAGHIAKAFCGDGKAVSGNGNRP